MVLYLAVPAVFSALLTRIFSRLAPRLGLMDAPDHPRKKHENTAALTGGLAVFFAWLAASFFLPATGWTLPLVAGLLVATGAVDDRRHLSPLLRLALQAAAAALLVFGGGIVLRNLGHVAPDGTLLWMGWFGPVFTAVCFVLLVNAWNFIDGLDGLASGATLVVLGWFMFLARGAGLETVFWHAATVIAAILGFLPFNIFWRKFGARPVFLGDAGSLFLGLMAGWLAVTLASAQEIPLSARVSPAVIAWVLAFPVFDLGCVALRRILAGRSPMRADKIHFHHLLVRRGFSTAGAAFTVVILTALCGACGIAFRHFGVDERVMLALWLMAFALHVGVSVKLSKIR